MNTKGIKFLAALAVLAMAFAAFAVIAPAEDNDAATVGPLTVITEGKTITATGQFYAGSDATITLSNSETSAAVTVYVYSGSTLTVKFGAGNLLDLTLYEINKKATLSEDGKTASFDNEKVTIGTNTYAIITDGQSGTIEYKATTSSTATTYTTISGSVTGTVDVGTKVAVVSGGSFLVAGAAVANLVKDMTYTDMSGAAAVFTYYRGTISDVISLKTTADDQEDTLVATGGSATVSAGNNTVRFTQQGDQVLTFTYDYNATPANQKLVVEGKVGAKVDGGVVKASGELAVIEGSVTVGDGKLGQYTNTEDSLATGIGSYITGAVATASVLDNFDAHYGYYAAEVVIKDIPSAVLPKIIGNYTLINKNEKFTENFTVDAWATFTVPEKYTLTIGDKNLAVDHDPVVLAVSANSTLDIWGTVKGVAHKNNLDVLQIPSIDVDGTMKVRKNASVTELDITGAGVIQELPNKLQYNQQSGSIDSTQTIEILSLGGDLTIPKDVTVTVTDMLDLNGWTLTVNGELIIAQGAAIGGKMTNPEGDPPTINGAIVLKDGSVYGKITINGVAGKNVPVKIAGQTMVGLTGFVISQTSKAITVSGELKSAEAMFSSELDLDGATIKNMAIPTNVTVAVAVKSYVTGELTVKGNLILGAKLVMKEGSSIDVTGKLLSTDAANTLQAEVSAIGSDLTVGDDDYKPVATDVLYNVEGVDTAGTTYIISGFKFEVVKTEYIDDNDVAKYYQRAYLSGSLTSSPAVVGPNGTAVFKILNQVFVGYGDELSESKKYALMTFNNTAPDNTTAILVVEGKYTRSVDNPISEENIIGAIYSTGKDETAKVNVVDIVSGLEAVAGANDKTVKVNTLDKYEVYLLDSITFEDGQIIQCNSDHGSLIIPEGVVVTVNSGANVAADMLAAIEGKLIVMKGGSCDPAEALYDVTSENAAKDVTYCGFQTALDDSQEGDVITITGDVGTPTAIQTLTIPTKRTIEVEGSLTILKSLVVAADATLVVTGDFTFGTATTKSSKITVVGTMDVSGAKTCTLDGYHAAGTDYNLQVVSTGKFIYKESKITGDANDYTFVGAVYKDGTNSVLSNVATAIENGAKAVVISEDYTDLTPIELSGATLTIAEGKKASFGTIDAKDGTIVADGSITATINGIDGEDIATQLVVTGFTGTITNKAKADVYTMDIADMKAESSLTVASGVISVSADTVVISDKKSFNVNAGAGLVSDGVVDFQNAGTMNLAGTVYVKDGNMTVSGAGKLTISGDMYVEDIAAVVINSATISGDIYLEGTMTINTDTTLTGNIVIDDSEGATAALTLAKIGDVGADLIVGTNPYTGAAATISGTNINLSDESYIAVYAGSSIPEKMIEDKDLRSTVFMLNGAVYLTAYVTAAGSANVIAISAAALDDAVINKVVKIEGFDMANMTDATKWKDAEGNALLAGALVASTPVMTFEGVSYNARVLVSSVTGVSVFVDGVRYDSGTTIDGVKVGTHTVSVTINPGYKGTTATTFNGKTVTSSFEVTPDMTGVAPAAVVLSVTGDISIDSGDAPAPTPEEKSEWTITTILLVVLIILIAVMVIVVLLRMNRS